MSSAEPVKEEGAGIQTEHVKPSESSTGAEPATSTATAQETKATVEDVPDPDEDDLDDLDGMDILSAWA